MSRSKWKGPVIKNSLLKYSITNSNKNVTRNATIPSCYLNKFVNISTGKEFKKIYISKEKIGLKFGTFAYTRKGKVKPKIVHKKK